MKKYGGVVRTVCGLFSVCALGCVMLRGGVAYAGTADVNRRMAEDIEERVLKAEAAGAGAREISDLYVLGAGRCRDAGGRYQVVELFEKAVQADPANVRARRLYGDYLSGYRGMFQYAKKQYFEALKVVKEDPGSCTDEEARALARSFQIYFRDVNEGVPVVISEAVTVSLELNGEYSNKGIKGSELAGYEATADQYYNGSYRQEREDGVSYFSRVAEESGQGIVYFQGVRRDQEDGIDYFAERVNETYEGEAYFMGKFDPIDGPVYSLDEPLDAEGNTIRSRVIQIREARLEYEERIAAIERDIQDTDQRIAAAEKATAEYWKRVEALQAEINGIEQKKEDFAKALKRRQESWTTRGAITLRFSPAWTPYVTVEGERTKTDNVGYNLDSETDGTNEGTYDRVALLAGKRWIMRNVCDVHLQAGVSQREAEVVDADNLTFNEETHRTVQGLVELSRDFGFDTARVMLSGSSSEIDVKGLDPQDEAYDWTAAFRYSFYPASELELATERARSRLSQHVEFGLRRTFRNYHSNERDDVTKERHWKPYFSYEALSLWNGKMDFTVVYNYDDGNEYVIDTVDAEGNLLGQTAGADQLDAHEIKLIPAWVAVYKRYLNDFTTGVEYLRWKFPLTYETGDGNYENYRVGTGIEGDYITALGFGFRLDLGGEYRWFENYGYDDWGIYLKCELIAGRIPSIDRALIPVE